MGRPWFSGAPPFEWRDLSEALFHYVHDKQTVIQHFAACVPVLFPVLSHKFLHFLGQFSGVSRIQRSSPPDDKKTFVAELAGPSRRRYPFSP